MKSIIWEWKSLGSSQTYPLGQLTVGVVLMENGAGEISCRIGLCTGIEERYDIERIMQTGGKLTMTNAIGFFPLHKDLIEKNWKE